jgi:membrane-bound ClpP family serine protease
LCAHRKSFFRPRLLCESLLKSKPGNIPSGFFLFLYRFTLLNSYFRPKSILLLDRPMTILILSSLLIIGLILLLIEVLFIPGTTVVGILGLGITLTGVVYAFASYDSETAYWIIGIAGIFNLIAIWYGFSSGVWNRFSLKSSMQGGAFDGRTFGLTVGMIGKAVSDIKPIGKAEFGGNTYEVKSEDGFIEVGREVKIVKIENNKIIVK